MRARSVNLVVSRESVPSTLPSFVPALSTPNILQSSNLFLPILRYDFRFISIRFLEKERDRYTFLSFIIIREGEEYKVI